jgi:hypothetical protein
METQQLNIEYFFRLLYAIISGTTGELNLTTLQIFFAKAWLAIMVVGYGSSLIAFAILIYASMRLFELRKREEEYYSTLIAAPETAANENPRWKHIQMLMEGVKSSEWREAITEADIMLDDVLMRKGYEGENLGERLKSMDRSMLASLDDAWEAHKVRNKIAHEGSAFDLSQTVAQRTIAMYENVFRELGAV